MGRSSHSYNCDKTCQRSFSRGSFCLVVSGCSAIAFTILLRHWGAACCMDAVDVAGSGLFLHPGLRR